jgi:AcrR family transcriptional regulator
MKNKEGRILNAALERFNHFGFVKTTVDEIARQAQVGKGTIYAYFKSKEEILLALVDREFTKGFTLVAEAMNQEKTALGKLKKMLQTSFDYFHKNKLVSKVMAMDPGLVLSVITEKNRAYQQLSIAGIQSILEQGEKEGVFRKVNTKKVAYTIDSLIRSFHYLNYLGLEIYKPEEIFDSILDLLSSGLKKK